jgi:predicted Ser/Thr protein kinase
MRDTSSDNIPTSPMPADDGSVGEPVGPPPPSVEELSALFPQLEFESIIGTGGMGAVFKARQRSLNRTVAVKVLPREVGRQTAFADRFEREARALARLAHPGIVSVFDSGEAGGFYFFVMEFVDGPNLRQLLRNGKLPPPEALGMVAQICEALQYAHDQGVVHRDIKPENVLLDPKMKVRIADFGIAKLVGQHAGTFLTRADVVMGTPQYMAPEQVERPMSVDGRADIYALGVMFYEMLTGELPMGRFPPPSATVGVDYRFDALVLRALEKDPAKRYPTATDFQDAATTVMQGRALPGSRPPVGELSLTPARKLWLGIAIGLFVLLFASLFIIPQIGEILLERAGRRVPRRVGEARLNVETVVNLRSAGPVISEPVARVLGVTPSQRAAVNSQLGRAYRESIADERAHTKVRIEEGQVFLDIERSENPPPRLDLATLLAPNMEGEDGRRRREVIRLIERAVLPQHDGGVTICLVREGMLYRFDVTPDGLALEDLLGDSPAVFPARYRPYWIMYGPDAAAMQDLLAEIEATVAAGPGLLARREKLAQSLNSKPDLAQKMREALLASGDDEGIVLGPVQLVQRFERLARSVKGLPEPDESEDP